jgi:hypothetical protein
MSERPSLAASVLLACLATEHAIVRAHDFPQSESTVEFDTYRRRGRNAQAAKVSADDRSRIT